MISITTKYEISVSELEKMIMEKFAIKMPSNIDNQHRIIIDNGRVYLETMVGNPEVEYKEFNRFYNEVSDE